MSERTYEQISNLPTGITPLTGDELVEVEQDGVSRKFSMSALGGVPSAHAASHGISGSDPVGTQDKTANSIPVTDGDGTLDVFVSDSSTTKKGKVQLADNNESAASKAVQGNDIRLSDSRTPTAHAASHLGGSDTLGLGTAAFKDIGLANGVCPLNASSQVDSGYLPSYFDDVIEVANYAALPVTGESGKIYVTLDANLTYRWSGSAYVEISKSLALGETSSTAYRGDRGKTAYDHSQVAGNPHGTAIADIENLSGSITPLSDLSRVFYLDGSGIPTFPDNAAGTIERLKNITTHPSAWSLNNSPTETFINGVWHIVANNAYGGVYRNATTGLFIIRARALAGAVIINFADGYGGDKYIYPNDGWKNVYLYNPNTSTIRVIATTDTSTVFEISDDYIGYGLFDTPVYGKDGQTVWTNHGVLTVPGKRGNAMLFQGAQYLEASTNLPLSGAIAFTYTRYSTGGYEQPIANFEAGPKTGIALMFNADNTLMFVYGDGTNEISQGTGAGALADGKHTYVVNYTQTTLGPVYRDGIPVSAQIALASTVKAPAYNNTRIGAPLWSTVAHMCVGLLDGVRIQSTPMSQNDATRYHNGDDPIDCQQKSATGSPNALAVYNSDGGLIAKDNRVFKTYQAGEAITAGQLCYLHTDGKVYLADADAESSSKGALYIAQANVALNATGNFQRGGEVMTTGLSAGAIYYVSNTPGAYTTTTPTGSGDIVRVVGYAQSSTVLFFSPSQDYVVLV